MAQNTTEMEGVRKTFGLVGLGLVMMSLMNCAGGFVSNNGIFENDYKALKEALVGSWQIVNPEYEVAGKEMYEFYREKKEVKLKVLGETAEIQRFDSPDGLSFTLEYAMADGKPTHVIGQFKSYERKNLVCMQEVPAGLPESLSVIRLEKRAKAEQSVIAGVKHDRD